MNQELKAQLDTIFNPRGVAVLGASDRQGNFGGMFVRSFLEMGFPHIYPVNPRGEAVAGIRAFSKIDELPDDTDLAVVATPTDAAPEVVKQCAGRGIRGLIIYSAGFGERDSQGKAVQDEMVATARRLGTRIIGPNCMGIYCPSSRLTTGSGLPQEAGSVGLISHSGSLTGLIVSMAAQRGVRFSKAVSCGNESDLNAADFLEYLGEDPQTRIIVAYLEGMREGRRFFELAKRVSTTKPVIIWKGGITQRGARAAASHTGAMAGSGEVWKTLFAQAGIVSVNSAENLVDCLIAFYHLPLPRGNRVVIISGPGGPAVGTSDACIEVGLSLAELSPETRQGIMSVIPAMGTSIDNPVDLGMASGFFPQWYAESIKLLGKDPEVDMLLIIGGGRPDFYPAVSSAVQEAGKPAVLVRPIFRFPEEAQLVATNSLLTYTDGRRAAVALAKLAEYANFVNGRK